MSEKLKLFRVGVNTHDVFYSYLVQAETPRQVYAKMRKEFSGQEVHISRAYTVQFDDNGILQVVGFEIQDWDR